MTDIGSESRSSRKRKCQLVSCEQVSPLLVFHCSLSILRKLFHASCIHNNHLEMVTLILDLTFTFCHKGDCKSQLTV